MDNTTKIMLYGSGSVNPVAFSFTDVTGSNPSTLNTSNTVTITGLGTTVTASVSVGGEISINGGAWVTSGSISNGQTLAVRATSSASFNTETTYTVTVGTVSDIWSITTRAADLVPAAFSFTTQNSAELSTLYTSNTVTITGLEPNYVGISITVSGSGSPQVAAGTSAIGAFGSSATATVSGTGTIVVAVRATSSAAFSSGVTATVTIGGVNGSYTINTRAADTTPGAYSFTSQSNVEPSTSYTSNTVTVSGLEPNTTIGITATGGTVSAGTTSISGSYSTSTSATTTGSGTLVVSARVTSSSSFSTGATVTVNVGSGSGTFTVTTRAADIAPTAFSFTDQTNVERSTLITSNLITVSGLEPNYSVTVSCTGGSIDAGTSSAPGVWVTSKSVTTSGTGTLVVRARQTSSASFGTAVSCSISVGSGSDPSWTVTTRGPDLTPSAYSFTSQTNVPQNIEVYSNTVTVTGLEPNYSVTLSSSGDTGHGLSAGTTAISGSYSTSTSVTTSGTGTLVVRARVRSSSTALTSTTCNIFVGAGVGTFTVTSTDGSGGA